MHQRKGRLRAALADSRRRKSDDGSDWEHDFRGVYRKVA
jgi:hypothetical protein